MSVIQLQGLKGLKGLSGLSKQEYDGFVTRNKDLIAAHNYDPLYVSNLYSNKQFIDKFGIDQFKAMPNIEMRNKLFEDTVTDEEWEKYSPINADGTRDNSRGLGADWEKYSQMSRGAKRKVMESPYLTPSEFEENWRKTSPENIDVVKDLTNHQYISYPTMPALASPRYATIDIDPEGGMQEAGKKIALDRNQRILDQIYNDDADAQAKMLGSKVGQAYSDPAIQSMSDEQVKDAFIQAITPNKANMGIAEYAAYYGNGSNVQSEMENFSIDDMRQVLAKHAVYNQYMSPEMANTVLNNDAKRYIKKHQSKWTRFGLFAKDAGISALSYSADKANSIYNLGLMAADAIGGKPVVWVDDVGNVVDPDKVAAIKQQTSPGEVYGYTDENGQFHPVHQAQVNRTTLHLMGKNSDGSDDTSLLNPQYWTRAEQFGTLDEDLQKKYERLGVSPYKVAYNPNEDTDLWYESFKMVSFHLADGGSQLIPFGIGQVGKVLSTAAKVGKVVRGLGQAMNYAGKALTAETKAGQVVQGLAGAGGISYAYGRGAFQETLQQNLANAEQTVLDRSRNEIYEQYNNDEVYKSQMDTQINALAASLKKQYIAQLGEEGKKNIVDEQALDRMLKARAREQVMGQQVEAKVKEKKASDEYAQLQEEAINHAGSTANAVFLPEAVKYGLINTVGFRKWLYSNPASLQKKAGQAFTGLREMTTAGGKQRLATKGSQFVTRGDKRKQFGKAFISQAWNGAWTNGTDDMMVDAAERINEDSFNRYLNAYSTGEGIADTHGFADGIYSYWKGLNNSLGQETTWDATAVGALGSIVSASPNMVNIAHLATKGGRQAYRDRYMQRKLYDTDANGYKTLKTDEQGKPLTERVKWTKNRRDRFNYFIQNGVLNTYYGNKIAEQDMQDHADYVNNILDDYDDFKAIEDLIVSDNALHNAESAGDQKTMRFIKAIHAMNALNHLGNNSRDPAAMSSVVQNAKETIKKAAQMTMDEGAKDAFTEEEIASLLSQYYANNPGVAQSSYNNQLALYHISENAQELQKAAQAYEEAEKQVQSVEKTSGKQIDPAVRDRMKMQQALDGHWRQRLETMKSEVDDTSTSGELSEELLIPVTGGRKNAEALVKVYGKQQKEIQEELDKQMKETAKKEEALDNAQVQLDNAQNSNDKYTAQQALEKAQAEVDDAHQQESYLQELLARTEQRRDQVTQALEKQATDSQGKFVDRVLTAQEIFALDPVSRAKMLRPENRQLYSKEQQRELDKLEQQLLMRDGNALEKVQDIALLTQRIENNQDAYSRMAQHPEAAAVRLEAQREQAADAAYKLINQRNAESVADLITQFDEGMKGHSDISQAQKEQFVFNTLRKLNPTLLDILQEDQMLPQYHQQVSNAKEWVEVTSDIDAVINNAEQNDVWKKNMARNINTIIDSASNKQEILSALEKALNDIGEGQTAADIETVLSGLEQLGYQRDATIVESRKQRQQREKDNKAAKVEQREAAKASAQEAAAKAATDAEAQAEKANKNPQNIEDVNLEDVPLEGGEKEEDPAKEEKKEVDRYSKDEAKVANATVNDFTKIHDGLTSAGKELYSKDSDRMHKELNDEVDATVDYLNAKISAREYLEKIGFSTDENSWLNSEGTTEREIKAEADEKAKVYETFIKDSTQQKTDSSVSHVMEDTNSVKGKTTSIEEQMREEGSKEQHLSDYTADPAVANSVGEHVAESSTTTLSGNAMSEWQPGPLQDRGMLQHKQGTMPNDPMNKYYAWMESASVKLQNIIDNELNQILRLNPRAKVKFMAVRPENNATHDGDLKRTLFLVLDYDNSINKGITTIHAKENGGVIKSGDKEYLIIGVAGYGNKNVDKLALYDTLFSNNPRTGSGYGLVRKGMGEFFRNNPDERFYVAEGLNTEVVPASLIPGYLVKQLEHDESETFRSVTELLNDPERNPLNLDLESLAWGIQEGTKFVVVGTSLDRTMIPRNAERNVGSAFVLVPAANGKMVPSYLKPLMWNEIREGALKNRINELLLQVVSPNYADRLSAVMELQNLFYMDAEKDYILVGKDTSKTLKNVVSLVYGGNVFRSFVLDSNFDRQQFMAAIAEMNPRINITTRVLQNPQLLRQYAEAGALQTDIARLSTAGSSYSIYGVDVHGEMLKPEGANNDIPNSSVNSNFRQSNKTQVVYEGSFYLYDGQTGQYSLNGNTVTDSKTLTSLDYNRRVITGQLHPVKIEGTWGTYVLGSEGHPEVIKIERNTKEVRKVSEPEAKALLEKIARQKAEEERKEAAVKEVEESQKRMNDAIEAGEVPLSDESLDFDPETGELVVEQQQKEQEAISEEKREIGKGGENLAQQQKQNQKNGSGQGKTVVGEEPSSQKFATLARSKNHRKQVMQAIKNKWPKAPSNLTQLEQFLRDKHIEVDAIDTSEEGLKAWIYTIENCR